MVDWNLRTYTVAEAAALAGLHRAALDNVISRASVFAGLFSEKKRHRRWFSQRDIATLRLAFELERGGRHWATAIAQAFERMAVPPPRDALLVIPVMSIAHTSGRVVTGPYHHITEQAVSLYPIGRIAADVIKASQEMKE